MSFWGNSEMFHSEKNIEKGEESSHVVVKNLVGDHTCLFDRLIIHITGKFCFEMG